MAGALITRREAWAERAAKQAVSACFPAYARGLAAQGEWPLRCSVNERSGRAGIAVMQTADLWNGLHGSERRRLDRAWMLGAVDKTLTSVTQSAGGGLQYNDILAPNLNPTVPADSPPFALPPYVPPQIQLDRDGNPYLPLSSGGQSGSGGNSGAQESPSALADALIEANDADMHNLEVTPPLSYDEYMKQREASRQIVGVELTKPFWDTANHWPVTNFFVQIPLPPVEPSMIVRYADGGSTTILSDGPSTGGMAGQAMLLAPPLRIPLGPPASAPGNLLTASERAITELAGKLRFTETAGRHMAEAGRFVPRQTLADAILTGTRMADPQGVAGAIKIVQNVIVNGKPKVLEIIYRESDSTILHFLYK